MMDIDFSKVSGIAIDSREVKPGFIFVAINGSTQNGHNYIAKAVANGANIIIHQEEIEKISGITYIKTSNSRVTLGELVEQFYPKQPKYLMGVTGTNGKSSVVHFVIEILSALNKKSVSIGTLGVLGDLQIDSKLTTPATIEMHKILNEIVDNNIEYTALECSSHGIDQHRLDHVKFKACAFTNFTQDHLDYHHTMEKYFEAKQHLFDLMKEGFAILNGDIPEYNDLLDYCLERKHKIICYGKKTDKYATYNITINSIKTLGTIQEVSWNIEGKPYNTSFNLVGNFQIYNIACAIGLLMGCGIDPDKIMPVLSKIKAVTGRMELVTTYNNASVFVDYAHTPDALEHSLRTLSFATKNKLFVIFGCGGDREIEKRPIMGEIAKHYADNIIITDDNPRNEDPAKIRQAIINNCTSAKEIGDREEAISFALSQLQPGDNLLIAGKGHETYQILKNRTIEFNDSQKVISLINALK
ncbi:MAG: UDP-N-acetylmuramoyl-L-alanyl-D-glutamate--2,6-diaminopimelate ligase [Rickettsiales bacterium]|jgi:UDP-N-acetylmuramoyl-L-alanyl-D-glutamate--2,6-diaminopimelate ligase|nr:UDP-N-acetylmuramoyl-L-alanyl-D-glutamate--2,6-diaminopimelate ligase [Rickettsiales bacterium]